MQNISATGFDDIFALETMNNDWQYWDALEQSLRSNGEIKNYF